MRSLPLIFEIVHVKMYVKIYPIGLVNKVRNESIKVFQRWDIIISYHGEHYSRRDVSLWKKAIF